MRNRFEWQVSRFPSTESATESGSNVPKRSVEFSRAETAY